MIIPAASPLVALVVLAGLLMVLAGVGKKQLVWRAARCPVCRHPRGHCICRWR